MKLPTREKLAEQILKFAETDSLSELSPIAAEHPAKVMQAYQDAMDEAANSGDSDALMNLCSYRTADMGEISPELRLVEALRVDLAGALREGHRDLVLQALGENVAPHDWDELHEAAEGDHELLEEIESAFESAEDQSWEEHTEDPDSTREDEEEEDDFDEDDDEDDLDDSDDDVDDDADEDDEDDDGDDEDFEDDDEE